MTKPILDDATLDNFSPREAASMLEKLNRFFKDGTSARQAVELHRIEKVLKAKAGSTYEPES